MAELAFADLCAALYGATVERQHLDFAAGRFAFAAAPRAGGPAARLEVVFLGVVEVVWKSAAPEPRERFELEVVGLERLKPGDVWRFYARPHPGAELELAAREIRCNGHEVVGVGRAYHDAPPRRAPGVPGPAA